MERIDEFHYQLPRRFGPKSTVHERFSEWVATGKLARAWGVLLREYDGARAATAFSAPMPVSDRTSSSAFLTLPTK